MEARKLNLTFMHFVPQLSLTDTYTHKNTHALMERGSGFFCFHCIVSSGGGRLSVIA